MFSDKKLFTTDQVYNWRNDCVIINQGTPATPENKTKHLASVMVLGVVSSDGTNCPPIFILAGVKVNKDVYIKLLATSIQPLFTKNYPKGNYVVQQDGAPSHTSKKSQEWLATNLKDFWDKTFWPQAARI